MTEDYKEEEFGRIAAAMKELPYFAPSPHFADRVMARVRIPGKAQVPAAGQPRPQAAPAPYRAVLAYAPPGSIERRAPMVPQPALRRSIPARLAATAIVASLGVTMTAVVLFSFFNADLLLLVSRVFGASTVSFLTALATDTSATVSATASSAIASAGTGTGAAVIGSFGAGVVAATVALRAAAAASRRAA